jgi:ABC-type amino acid transport substrate-binding protein
VTQFNILFRYIYFQVVILIALLSQVASTDILAACAKSSLWNLRPGPFLVLIPPDNSNLFSELLQELHAGENWGLFVSRADDMKLEYSEKPLSIIVPPISNRTELRNRLSKLTALNSRARFLILTQDEMTMHIALRELRDLNVVNAVLMVPTGNNSSVRAYTWFPYFPPGECGKKNITAVFLDECLIGNSATFVQNVSFFPQKVPHNLYGCPIVVSTFPWPPFVIKSQTDEESDKVHYTEGLEIKLISTIAQSLNSTLEYLSPPANDSKWGARQPDGFWTGLVGDVHYKNADVALASMTATEERKQYLETTITYWSNSVVWIVPSPKFISGWRSLLGIFKPTMWAVVLLAYLLASFALYSLSHTVLRLKESDFYRNPCNCFMATWALTLEMGTHVLPRGLIMRFVFTCWVIYSLQISTAYKSSLISSLTNPHHEPAILNMKQLANSRLKFQYTVGLSDYFDEPVDASMKLIRDSLRFCDNVTVCLKSLALTAETALVNDKSYVEYLIPRLYIGSNGLPLLQLVPQEVLSYHIVMVLSKGNLLLERFDESISRIAESGLTVKWARDIMYTRAAGAASQNGGGGRRLSMAHLQSMFVLLLIGEGLALATLIIEVVMRKIL